MTELQAKMIKKIATSEFSEVNGSNPETLEQIGGIWADCIIEDAEDKGVFTSLLKAGFVWHSGGKVDATCCLTEKGSKAYKQMEAWA